MLVMPAGAQTALPQNSRVEPEGQKINSAINHAKAEFAQNASSARQELRQAASSSRQDFLQQAAQLRQNFQSEVAAKREQLQSKLSAYKEGLKAKLSLMKDQRRAATIQNIDEAITNLNNQMVDHFVSVLNQLSEILSRIQTRADSASSRGLNITTVTADIAAAQTALNNASSAIKIQGAKVYEVNIATSSVNSKSTVKFDVKSVRDALHGDLTSLNSQVKSARDAVQKVAVDLGKIQGIDDDLKATSSQPANETSTSAGSTSSTSSQ